jgi:hypothetical protein
LKVVSRERLGICLAAAFAALVLAAGIAHGAGRPLPPPCTTALRAGSSRSLADQGRILIFSGADGIFSGADVSLIRRIDGEKATEQLGESLALADVNGDGYADLPAGAWSYDPGAGGTNKNNGIVRLYDGFTGDVLFERIGTERAEGIQDEMGRAVVFGDVNGDGELDLILGAGGGPGYVEVISGADFSTRLHLFRGDLSIGNEDQFGRAVAAADLNGDGKAEVIAGAHVGDGGGLGDSGWVRVFDGATGTVLFQFNGTRAQDHFGKSVAVGDVNGDGRLDVIVGTEWGTMAGFPPGAPLARRAPTKGGLRDHALWAISEPEGQTKGWWLDMPQAKSRCAPVTALQAAVA